MEVNEGFIVGVYNYCDRWCERCAFTSRCQLFADSAKYDALAAGALKAIAEAAPHPSDVREVPAWLEAILAGFDSDETSLEKIPDPDPLPPALADIVERAHDYRRDVRHWFAAKHDDGHRDHDDPLATIGWFSTLLSAKIYRAITGLSDFDGDREFPPDHEGSCKVALLGIDRSIAAWRDVVALRTAAAEDVAPFIQALERLRADLQHAMPRALAFVRPGFDEPEEVRKLEASDWS